jgi:hypothetical protein
MLEKAFKRPKRIWRHSPDAHPRVLSVDGRTRRPHAAQLAVIKPMARHSVTKDRGVPEAAAPPTSRESRSFIIAQGTQ